MSEGSRVDFQIQETVSVFTQHFQNETYSREVDRDRELKRTEQRGIDPDWNFLSPPSNSPNLV